MTTLLIAEHDNKILKDSTHKAVTAAKGLGGELHILVAGQNCRPVAEAAARLDGVAKVLLAENAAYEHLLAEPIAALIVSLAMICPFGAAEKQALLEAETLCKQGELLVAIMEMEALAGINPRPGAMAH